MSQTQHPEQTMDIPQPPTEKPNFIKRNLPLLGAATLLTFGGFGLGYMIGHKQGLTVVGFDADAQELAQIVDQQKKSIATMSTALNTATQERDLAVDNANELSASLQRAREAQDQAESLSRTYQDKLRERGGLSLSIQNLAIRPLPANAYEYVLDLVQVSPSKNTANGKVEIQLIGSDQILSVPLQSSRYSFENSQRLTGRWTMPSGFNPQYIQVYLKGGNDAVVQRFAWQRGKDSIESPASIAEIPQVEANAQ